jgi:hypothetical protein
MINLKIIILIFCQVNFYHSTLNVRRTFRSGLDGQVKTMIPEFSGFQVPIL